MRKQTVIVWSLLGVPLLVAALGGVLGWVIWDVVWATLLGALGVIVGGLMAGVTARRYLSEDAPSPHVVFGLGATGVIGTVALGYVYIFFIRYPPASIRTPARVLSQSVIFSAFLLAQYVGIVALYPYLASKLKWEL